MKVVFLEDVPNVARAGDIKEVANGYGRNYLLPKKLAVVAQPGALVAIKAQIEALYMMKGVKYENGDITESIKNDYLEFPVTFHFVPAMNGNVKPRFFAGPYLGLLLSSKYKQEGYADDSSNYEIDIKDQMKSTEFGATFGAGVDINALTFDLRYDLGLSKIMKETADGQSDAKSTGIYAMIGWRLGM